MRNRDERIEKSVYETSEGVFEACEPVMPYVASSNLGYYSVVYFLTFFLLICVGESLKFVYLVSIQDGG